MSDLRQRLERLATSGVYRGSEDVWNTATRGDSHQAVTQPERTQRAWLVLGGAFVGVLAVGVIGGVLLGGWGSPEPTLPVVSPTTSLAPPEGVAYDLAVALGDRYGIVGNAEVTRAEIAAEPDLASCMADAGWEYWPVDKTLQLDFATRMATFMFGSDAYPADVDEARSEGLGVGTGLLAAYDDGLASVYPEVPGRDENKAYVDALLPLAQGRYAMAMQSCRQSAWERVREVNSIRDLAGQVTSSAMGAMRARSDYSLMVGDWKTCMSASGLDLVAESPEQLRDLVMSWYLEDESLVATGVPLDMELFSAIQTREFGAAAASVECGADEEFGVKVDQILQEEIDAELIRRGLSLDDGR